MGGRSGRVRRPVGQIHHTQGPAPLRQWPFQLEVQWQVDGRADGCEGGTCIPAGCIPPQPFSRPVEGAGRPYTPFRPGFGLRQTHHNGPYLPRRVGSERKRLPPRGSRCPRGSVYYICRLLMHGRLWTSGCDPQMPTHTEPALPHQRLTIFPCTHSFKGFAFSSIIAGW